jgi:hypothetical protein
MKSWKPDLTPNAFGRRRSGAGARSSHHSHAFLLADSSLLSRNYRLFRSVHHVSLHTTALFTSDTPATVYTSEIVALYGRSRL